MSHMDQLPPLQNFPIFQNLHLNLRIPTSTQTNVANTHFNQSNCSAYMGLWEVAMDLSSS